jgi:site-specific DNA recombinase
VKTAIYARISKDAAGEGLGVERQVEACRKLAEAKGWTVDESWVLVENDTSASNGRRKEFERLIRGMERGEISAAVAYKVDRLVRRMAEAVRLWEIAQERQVLIATVAGDMDLSTPTGRGQAMLWSGLPYIEAETLRDRLEAKARQQVASGRNANAGRRPFGWDLYRVEHRDDEAAIIREMADRLIAGESLTGLANDLNERQVPTSGYRDRLDAFERGELEDPGKPIRWNVRKVREVPENVRHCGRIEHRGQTVVDESGTAIVAQWEPILHPDIFDQLQAALNSRRRIDARWTATRRHLLSGIARCGLCGERPVPADRDQVGVPVPRPSRPGPGRCRHPRARTGAGARGSESVRDHRLAGDREAGDRGTDLPAGNPAGRPGRPLRRIRGFGRPVRETVRHPGSSTREPATAAAGPDRGRDENQVGRVGPR